MEVYVCGDCGDSIWHAETALAPIPGRSSCVDPTCLLTLSQLWVFGVLCHNKEGLHSQVAGELAPQDRGRANRHKVPPQEWEAIYKILNYQPLLKYKMAELPCLANL